MKSLLDLVLHLDRHLADVTQHYGLWVYLILFAILFAETGFVVTPFLPGDSLLFAAGALAAGNNALHLGWLFAIFLMGAILGDTINFEIGKKWGPGLFKDGRKVKFLKRENLERTERFFEKYGSKAIVIARFVPVVRTFAPFVAGTGRMHYGHFIRFNIIGALLWVSLFVLGGYFFGNLPFVQGHFGFVVAAIIVLSLVPVAWEFISHCRHQNEEASALQRDAAHR